MTSNGPTKGITLLDTIQKVRRSQALANLVPTHHLVSTHHFGLHTIWCLHTSLGLARQKWKESLKNYRESSTFPKLSLINSDCSLCGEYSLFGEYSLGGDCSPYGEHSLFGECSLGGDCSPTEILRHERFGLTS